MKQLYFTVCFLITAFAGNAQNYSCIDAAHKAFFINDNHYLRGMRIDSVMISGSNKIYFPYKTARTGAFMDGQFVDTSGVAGLAPKSLRILFRASPISPPKMAIR